MTTTNIIKAFTSFIVVFVLSFVLGGWSLMPHLPPTPAQPVTLFELEYWTTNWPGAVVGVLLGSLSASSILRENK